MTFKDINVNNKPLRNVWWWYFSRNVNIHCFYFLNYSFWKTFKAKKTSKTFFGNYDFPSISFNFITIIRDGEIFNVLVYLRWCPIPKLACSIKSINLKWQLHFCCPSNCFVFFFLIKGFELRSISQTFSVSILFCKNTAVFIHQRNKSFFLAHSNGFRQICWLSIKYKSKGIKFGEIEVQFYAICHLLAVLRSVQNVGEIDG